MEFRVKESQSPQGLGLLCERTVLADLPLPWVQTRISCSDPRENPVSDVQVKTLVSSLGLCGGGIIHRLWKEGWKEENLRWMNDPSKSARERKNEVHWDCGAHTLNC